MNTNSLHQFGWYLRNVLLSEAGPELLKPALRALVLERALGAPVNKQEAQDGSDSASGTDKTDVGRQRLRSVLRRMTAYACPPSPSLEPFEQNALFTAEEFGLSPLDLEILLLVLRVQTMQGFESFCDGALKSLG